VHALAEMHETLFSCPKSAPPKLGVDRTDQLIPFHTSARVKVPLLLSYHPTAVQAVAELHEMPSSWLKVAPFALGVDRTDQLVPFHASARVTYVPALLW
jgi:hypothetical protein